MRGNRWVGVKNRCARLWILALALLAAPAAFSSEPPDCRTVRFGLFGYSDIMVTTTLASEALRRLGYTPQSIELSLPVIYQSLADGRIDVFLGNWMPAQQANLGPYVASGTIDVVGPNLEHAKFTLAVPHYLYEAGLRDFASIHRFAQPLRSNIYGIDPGAAANRLVLDMIKNDAFGLGGFRLVESSEQGMLSELDRANAARKPIVFLAWEPHPMNLRHQIDYLSGGDRYFGPDGGSATINTLTRAGYAAHCPNVGRLLSNLKFTLRGESELMAAIIDRHEAPEAAAGTWMQTHGAELDRWLVGVNAFDAQARSGPEPQTVPGRDAGTFEAWMIDHKIPVGAAATAVIEAAKTHGAWLFDTLSLTMRTLLDGVTAVLRAIPVVAFLAVAGLASGLLRRSWSVACFVAVGLVYVLNQGYWDPMLETLSLVLVATLLSSLIGVPVGIAAAHHPRFSAALRPVLDLMQTLPAFVYLIPTLLLFGLGPVPGLISTVIFALPAPIRLTEAGIKSVPIAYKEAAEAFGASKRQLLWKVELPAALPMVRAGITQCIMLSLSMVVIAALVGAGGLGVPVIRALNSVQVNTGFEAGFTIVLLAILLDRVGKTPPTR